MTQKRREPSGANPSAAAGASLRFSLPGDRQGFSVPCPNVETTKKIPTYSADGSRRRRYSLEAIERLLSLHLVVVQRNRKGAIAVAMFRPLSGANPIRPTAHTGTKYSFHERLDDGHHAWTLHGLPQNEHEDADLFVRAIFRAVPLSCMKRDAECTGNAREMHGKVVDIAAFKRQRTARPIEFDSERRAA